MNRTCRQNPAIGTLFVAEWLGTAERALALLVFGWAIAESVSADLVGPAPVGAPGVSNALVRSIGGGKLAVGQVEVDPKRRTLEFPAAINMDQGLVEYALVTGTGKIHESLLRTTVEPYQLHVAALLLGIQGGGVTLAPVVGGASTVLGDPVRISVNWAAGRQTNQLSLEAMIWDQRSGSAAAKADWLYTGSKLSEGGFTAQRDGSIIALIADPDALINNPRLGRDDDEIWHVATNAVPRPGTAVRVVVEWLGLPKPK